MASTRNRKRSFKREILAMFVPRLVVYQFLRGVDDAREILALLQSFYDECLAYRNWKYSKLDLCDIRLAGNTIAMGVCFRKAHLVDRWDFYCIDKGCPLVYGELLWSNDFMGKVSKREMIQVHEDLAVHLAQHGSGIVVGLQYSKKMRPNYESPKSSFLERIIFGRFYLLGSDIDLYLYQKHFRALVELSRNPRVATVVGINFHDLRELLPNCILDETTRVVRETDIKHFAADCDRQLETRLSPETMSSFRAMAKIKRDDETEYSYAKE